jgi:hypothetical protein
VMIFIGVFHAIAGLSGIIKDDFYAVLPNYVLKFDVTTWGWIHLIGVASSSSLRLSAIQRRGVGADARRDLRG